MRPIRVGIAGYGTVGGAAGKILLENGFVEERTGVHLQLTAVCDLANISLPGEVRLVREWKELVTAPDVDIVVETIGGTSIAFQVIKAALEAGKPVVTANKNLIAQHGDELLALAAKKRLRIAFEASVGGGVPILRTITEGASGDRLRAVYGILNGTVNYILTQMETRYISYETALEEAQQKGYAEADPTFDVDGIDAQAKLCILARLAFNTRVVPSQIPTTGIRHIKKIDVHYAERLESRIRLVGAAELNGNELEISVRPWLVSRRSMLSRVDDVNNAFFLEGERLGTQMFLGRGAGGGPTGAAIVSDLVELGREIGNGVSCSRTLGFQDGITLPICRQPKAVPWYIRLSVADRPGIVARVADSIAKEGINIHSVVQEPGMSAENLSFVITVEAISEPAMQRAVARIDAMDFMVEPVMLLRMVE